MTTIPIAIPPGTRALRIERARAIEGEVHETDTIGWWRIWIHTTDYIYGTYLQLCDDGVINRITVREDEGDAWALIKGPD